MQAMYGQHNIEAGSLNRRCLRIAKIITYSSCVPVALVTYRVMRMRRIILTSVACRAVPYFPALSHKRHDFRQIRY